jgi:hypothetical protein
MKSRDIHFEVFVRRSPSEPWRLEAALENRDKAVALGEALFDEGAAAVRVSKEVRAPDTGDYDSYVILTKGAQLQEKRKPVRNPEGDPPCLAPQDLHAAVAREKIGRLLEDWLKRQRATPFELLHRPDLAQTLDASGTDLQHAIQKIAVAKSQLTGASVHEVIRALQRLADGVLERLTQASRKQLFPDLDREPLAAAAERLADTPERNFLLGGAVARRLADAPDWSAKADRLIELAEGLPDGSPTSGLCLAVIEQPLSEIVGSQSGLSELLGTTLDPGGTLLALTRLVFPAESEAVMAADHALAALFPELSGPAPRLARLMRGGRFKNLHSALGRRILAELANTRRLRPDDADGEIIVLRALAMVLTAVLGASAGRLLSVDDVQAAFLTRSKALTANEFVTALSQGRRTVLAEAQALTRLTENVTGPVNRKRAANWLSACVGSPRFESELRGGGADTAFTRLSALAALDRAVRRAGLGEGDQRQLCDRLGELAGKIEADARLCALLVRSAAPWLQRVNVLLRLAGGETAPPGPAADRARSELVRLLKAPEARAELAASPEVANRVRELMAA